MTIKQIQANQRQQLKLFLMHSILEKGVKGIKNVGINTNKIILSFTSLREEEYNFAEYPNHKPSPKS